MANSEPETLKVSDWVSASVAVTVPMLDWFSAALKVAKEVKLVGLSFSLIRSMITFSVF